MHRRPRVAIISTGSELVEVDQPLGPGQIRNSNSYTLQTLVPADGSGTGPVRHRPRRLRGHAQTGDGRVWNTTCCITSGGVSVGEFDFVKDVQDELGVERKLWEIAMKPGKPLVFGVRGQTLVFGRARQPGRGHGVVRAVRPPALLRLMGHRAVLSCRSTPPSSKEAISNRHGRVYVVRVRAWREDGAWHVSSTGAQGSGILRSMVGANGLALHPRRPPGRQGR